MIHITNITKEFNSGGHWIKAVNNLSFDIEDNSFVSIIGKSGSGKSTLLSLLGALDNPTEGTITVDGEDITKLRGEKLNEYRRNSIGFVFQNYNLLPHLTAHENVMIAMEFNKDFRKDRAKRAQALLEQVGLDKSKQSRKPGKLSGGEQQRVSIARAIANNPKVVFADEPTGNLDSATGKMIFDLLHSLTRTNNTTVVVVTHDLSIAGLTDKTFTLYDGRLS